MYQNKTIRPPHSARFWMVVLVLAGIFAAAQGGLPTEVLRGRLAPSAVEVDSYFKVGFSVVPPTVISSHLGKLALFSPWQLLVALLEVGPLVLVFPLVLAWGYGAYREGKWLQAALVASAIPSLLSIFIQYSGNAGVTATTRLLATLFLVCKLFAVPLIWLWLQNQPDWKRSVTYTLGGIATLSGVVLLALQLIAIPRPVYTDFITDMDAVFYERYWNRLSPESAWVLDPESSRAPTLFGRQADSLINWGVYKPEYETLLANPDPYLLNAEGYHYIYADKDYWKRYAAELDQSCVVVMETIEGVRQAHGGLVPDFRQLADISACK